MTNRIQMNWPRSSSARRSRRVYPLARLALPVFEQMEPRRLLAFTTADYLPLGVGDGAAHYAGTWDGEPATAERTTAFDAVGKASVVRWDMHVTTPTQSVTSQLYFSLPKEGLYLHRLNSIADAETEVIITPGQPIHLLRQDAPGGGVLHFAPIETEVLINDRNFGQLVGRGTLEGTTSVHGLERVDLPDGRFIDALKFTVDLAFQFAGETQGVDWKLAGGDFSTYWLGYRIGLVKHTESASATVRAPAIGVDESASASTSLTLSSIGIPETDVFEEGVLTMTGTIFDDVMSVTSAGSKVVATQAGVSKEYDASAVQQINVFALPGKDIVMIGPGVRGLYVDAGEGNDFVTGGEGPDTLTGGAGKDRLDGGPGTDRVNGNSGHDNLIGGADADRLYGGNENDTLEGGGGVDRLWGGSGDDLLSGGGSSDKIFGEAGNDSLYGGNHNDLLNAGPGTDFVFGGPGNDVLNLLDNDEIDTADGGDDLDTAHADPLDLLTNI